MFSNISNRFGIFLQYKNTLFYSTGGSAVPYVNRAPALAPYDKYWPRGGVQERRHHIHVVVLAPVAENLMFHVEHQ